MYPPPRIATNERERFPINLPSKLIREGERRRRRRKKETGRRKGKGRLKIYPWIDIMSREKKKMKRKTEIHGRYE